MAKTQNKTFSRVSLMLKQVQDLRDRRTVLQDKIEEIDAKIADIQLDWNDLQKEIAFSIFGSAGETRNLEAAHPGTKKKTKKKTAKKRKRRRKNVAVRRKSDNLGSRAQIQAAAKARDATFIKVLQKSKKPMSLHEIHKAVKNGSLEQMRTSAKRLRKRKLITCDRSGKSARYTLKGK